MRRAWAHVLGLIALTTLRPPLPLAGEGRGEGRRSDGIAVSAAAAPAPDRRLLALLAASDGADVVAFDPPATPPSPSRAGGARLQLAARVAAPVSRLAAVLADPQAYRRAIPAFVRAEVLRTEGSGTTAATLIAWELEIPLWNLEGTLWLRPRPDGVELELAEGDLRPGKLRLRALPDGPATATLMIEGAVSIRNANFVTRRLAARDPLAEPAMTATAAYVMLRALALEAARTGDAPVAARWPSTPPRAPAADELAPGDLARHLARRAPDHQTGSLAALALVKSRPDGRLQEIQVALGSPLPAATLQARLAQPARWRALPGWKQVQVRGTATAPIWEVDSNLPFVDFDAIWKVTPGSPLRARADAGDWRGPVLAWQVMSEGAGPSVAALALHPHLERTGYLPRKLIEAEPLLEHGLALGLTYVNAFSLIRAISR